MVTCCVPNCKASAKKTYTPRVSFHEFPTNLQLCFRWIDAIGRKDWDPFFRKCSRVCSLHFREGDYKECSTKKMLKKDAVPTIFSDYPELVVKVKPPKPRPDKRLRKLEMYKRIWNPARCRSTPRARGWVTYKSEESESESEPDNWTSTDNSDVSVEISSSSEDEELPPKRVRLGEPNVVRKYNTRHRVSQDQEEAEVTPPPPNEESDDEEQKLLRELTAKVLELGELVSERDQELLRYETERQLAKQVDEHHAVLMEICRDAELNVPHAIKIMQEIKSYRELKDSRVNPAEIVFFSPPNTN